MKRWWKPKTVKLCLVVIAGAVGGWAADQLTAQQALIAVVGGLYGVFDRLGTLKLENALNGGTPQGQEAQNDAASSDRPS